MRACRLLRTGLPGEFEIADIPGPQPSSGQVVVRVRACGLNRLDLWVEEGGLPVSVPLPLIQGCEIAGEVLQTGPGTTGWQPGDRVAIQSNLFCGQCEFCAQGEESICMRGEILGVHRHGGFAEQVLVPASNLVRLPDQVSFEQSAALTLAGSTAMHMLTHRATVAPGATVLVVAGASGVGSAAIQIARGLGADVLALASTEAKRDFAISLGARAAWNGRDPAWPKAVREATGKRGVDLVVEHVGGKLLAQCFECLARNGTVVTCGATAGRRVEFDLWPFFVKQHRLVGSYGRHREDMRRTLEWAANGRLRAALHRLAPLDELPESMAQLRREEVIGKTVILP
ncbi:MAG: zinc-binding dehydrogenase [Verrucomicrobia bacterium]|nr:zinc-binding dehydrogenase [Verrucomicrobiota bacterium]